MDIQKLTSRLSTIGICIITMTSLYIALILPDQNQIKYKVNELNARYKKAYTIVKKQHLYIKDLEAQILNIQTITISFYHPNSGGINSDIDPDNTATMTTPIVGKTVAISKELFDIGWLGCRIYIDGFGIFKAEDRMSSSIKGKQVDICVSSKKEALRLGMKYNINAVRMFNYK